MLAIWRRSETSCGFTFFTVFIITLHIRFLGFVLVWFCFGLFGWVFLGMCGLLVAVLRLSYSLAHEILVPQPRIQPTSPAREGRILSHWTTREVSTYSFFNLLSVSPVQGLQE